MDLRSSSYPHVEVAFPGGRSSAQCRYGREDQARVTRILNARPGASLGLRLRPGAVLRAGTRRLKVVQAIGGLEKGGFTVVVAKADGVPVMPG